MTDQKTDFFFPERKDLPLRAVHINKWYRNLLLEISTTEYSNEELALLYDKHNYYGKYLSDDSRNFFLNHFGRNLVNTINYFVDSEKTNQRFLEIGSGCGNQLLLLAFMGVEVYGCDIRKDVCDLVQKRKEFYERVSGRRLNISIICSDVLKVDWNRFGTFDGINFLFSFNDIQPYDHLLGLVHRLLKPKGRAVFQETNQSNYYNRLFRRRNSMTPRQFAQSLRKYNFKINSLQGGYALPPVFWRFLPRSILHPLDQLLCRSLFMAPSYHLMAEKI